MRPTTFTRSFVAASRFASISMLISTALAAGGCLYYVEGNGELAEEQREVAAFSSVSVSGIIGLELVVDPGMQGPITLEVSGDSNLLPWLQTRVSGDRLIVEISDGVFVDADLPLTVKATVPDLTGIHASGSTTVHVDGIGTPALEVGTSGSSRIELAGSVEAVGFSTSGSSEVYARDLRALEVRIDASGSSFFEVCADDRLEVDASGSSMVRYFCEPEAVLTDVSGSAEVLPYAG